MSTWREKMGIFRAKKLILGGFVTLRILRDHSKRVVYHQHETERQALRFLARNTTLLPRVRAEAQMQLQKMPSYTCPTKIKNRCMLGGKARGVLRDFKMTRYNFRVQAMAGNIPGVKRASW